MSGTSPWWPVALLIAGAAATYVWRALGVALSGRIVPQGRLFGWVACVAYALLSGRVARMIVLPSGSLSAVALCGRVGAAALALLVFFLARRNMPLGVVAGVAVFMGLSWAYGAGLL